MLPLFSESSRHITERGERKRGRKAWGEREGEGERGTAKRRKGGKGGSSRPVAEGLILNVLQRRCLLSSLASPLTAPASKQDLSPLPPPRQKEEGRKRERRRLLKMMVLLPGRTLSPPSQKKKKKSHNCEGQSLSLLPPFVSKCAHPALFTWTTPNESSQKMCAAHFARCVPTLSNHEGQNGLDLF